MAQDQIPEKKISAQQKAHQQEIENSLLVLTAEVLRCNKNTTTDTETLILEFLTKQFGKKNDRNRLQTIATHIETGTEPFSKIACKELTLLTTHSSRISVMLYLFSVANADEYINQKELKCLHRIAGYLGISEQDFKALKRDFLKNKSPYAALEVEDSVSFEEVKTAYRKMVLKYHPDKRAEGVTEAEAASKFREIQKAFESIKQKLP